MKARAQTDLPHLRQLRPQNAELALCSGGNAQRRNPNGSKVITMKRVTRVLLLAAALPLADATPVIAGSHTTAECREGGEFIRNATLSRDNGLPKDAFLRHLIADLSMIRSLPAEIRWFARDEADESLLIRHAERVYNHRRSPKDHEKEFLAECDKNIDDKLGRQTP